MGSTRSPQRRRYAMGVPKLSTRGQPHRAARVWVHGPIGVRSSTCTCTHFPCREDGSMIICRCTMACFLFPRNRTLKNIVHEGECSSTRGATLEQKAGKQEQAGGDAHIFVEGAGRSRSKPDGCKSPNHPFQKSPSDLLHPPPLLPLCYGGQTRRIEVSLCDEKHDHFYPVLSNGEGSQ